MKRFITACTACFLLTFVHFVSADEPVIAEAVPSKPAIVWQKSLENAKEIAQQSNLPIYLCFTGPTWCPWCKRLDNEIQTQNEFIDRVYNKFVFVKIDIPKDPSTIDISIRELMLKYKVYGVPVILILSPDLKELGRLSYQSVSPQNFADLALGLANQKK